MEWPLFHHPEPEHLGPEQPYICPVCGSTNIKSSPRQSVVLADEYRDPISGILSHKCGNGHVSIAAALHL